MEAKIPRGHLNVRNHMLQSGMCYAVLVKWHERRGICMNNKKKEHLDHSQPARRTTRRKQDKMNRMLNYLIGVVSILIVISLFVIFTGNDEQETADGHKEEGPVETESGEDEVEEADKEEPDVEQEPAQQEDDQQPVEEESDEAEAGAPVVSSSDQPVVDEVWTSDAWEPYPTAQTGGHTSTFTEGHIDYEEKLNAIYSVIPLDQQDSILWSIKNNGNAKSAIAVLSSADKEQKYRVAIEWVEGEGWLPKQVEVLNTIEGTY